MHSVLTTPKLWLESNAVTQLQSAGALPHAVLAVGMPDLHPGKNMPVGAVVAVKDHIYPSLIGNDIGCGFSCFLVEKVSNIKKLASYAKQFVQGVPSTPIPDNFSDWSSGFCTLGLGNHFIELGEATSGPLKGSYILTIHSGSRAHGNVVLQNFLNKAFEASVAYNSALGIEYLRDHNRACEWASLNRQALATSFAETLGLKLGNLISNLCHNQIERVEINNLNVFLHRKGANPSNKGLTFIAGSRGTPSLLVTPRPSIESLFTLPHGCGRKYNRGDMIARGKDLMKGLDHSFMNGTYVICADKNLIYEEHPTAYKDINQIKECLDAYNLIETDVIAVKPLLNYKTTETSSPKKKKKHDRTTVDDLLQ